MRKLFGGSKDRCHFLDFALISEGLSAALGSALVACFFFAASLVEGIEDRDTDGMLVFVFGSYGAAYMGVKDVMA